MRIQMWTYEYTIGSLDKPIVKQLVDEGQKLLACLDDLCKKDDVWPLSCSEEFVRY